MFKHVEKSETSRRSGACTAARRQEQTLHSSRYGRAPDHIANALRRQQYSNTIPFSTAEASRKPLNCGAGGSPKRGRDLTLSASGAATAKEASNGERTKIIAFSLALVEQVKFIWPQNPFSSVEREGVPVARTFHLFSSTGSRASGQRGRLV